MRPELHPVLLIALSYDSILYRKGPYCIVICVILMNPHLTPFWTFILDSACGIILGCNYLYLYKRPWLVGNAAPWLFRGR
jgi:hypothetical protein